MRAFLALLVSVGLLIGGIAVFQERTEAAQNLNCAGSAEYIANHQLAEQALSAQIQQHPEIYNKSSSELTPDDVKIVAGDVAFYVAQLSAIEAPDSVKATLATEIAMYATLSAMLYSAVSVPIDLSALYDDAGSSLAAALGQQAQALVASCQAYEGVYGDFLPDTV